MRRAIAATVVGGLLLGGAVATPSAAAARGGGGKAPGKARTAGPPKPRATATRTVAYAGYELQVPSTWPVYRLDEHPKTCVRYDVHAVYLGTPGADMRCTAGLVGRTQTVSIVPGHGGTAGAGAVTHSTAPVQPGGPMQPRGPVQPGGPVLQRLAAVRGTFTQDALNHEMRVALGASGPGVTLLGTYGTDPAVVDQVLSTLRRAPAGTPLTLQTTPPSQAGVTASARTSPTPTATSWRGVPANWPVEIVQPAATPVPITIPPPTSAPLHPVSGFDTCTAPAASTMRTWRSHYAAIGVYIGGANAACASGNLSAGWVKSVTGLGWGLMPTYVGPQAPCWGAGSGVLIDPGNAVAQGTAAAADAVSEARSLKLGTGSPVYYDMEAYKGGSSCTSAVLKFLGAWDRGVQAAGYLTGVYSSQDSGIIDMQSGAVKKMPGFTPPEAVWIALWDNVASLSDGTLTWPLAERAKQFAGNVNTTIGGVTLNIDRDFVGGPLAHLPRRIPRQGTQRGVSQTSSREPPRAHILTTWPYAATVLTPSST